MALTKVSGGILDPGINVAGIVTATGFDGPFIGGTGDNINAGIITATGFDLNGNGDISGNLVIGGNLTANGDFTTLNTTLREVEILRVDANTTAIAGIITQRGSGDILNLYDGSTEVFSVADGGNVSITGVTTIAHTGANQLTIKDSDTSGNGSSMRISFKDSGNTERFYIGNDESSNSYLYLGSPSGQNNNVALTVGGSTKLTAFSGGVGINGDLELQDTIYHAGDTDTKIRFPGPDQITLEAGGNRGLYVDPNGNLVKAASGGVGNASVYARDLFISGSGYKGITIHTTSTSGNRGGCIFFGEGTSVPDMASGIIYFNHNSNSMHFSTGGSMNVGKSLRINDVGDVRFDSTPTSAHAMSVIIKSHKSRVVDDNNGICFLDGVDHTQAVINVQKKNASNATSDLVFRTSSGQVVNTLQGIPERMRLTSDGVLKIERGSASDAALEINTTSTSNACRIKFNESGSNKAQIAYSHDNDRLELVTQSGNGIAIYSGGNLVWKFDTNGHLLPNTAGAVNIGSTSAEIGDIFIADNKKAYFGSDQDLEVYHNGTNAVVKETTGRLYVLSDNLWFKNQADNSTTARFLNGDSVILYYNGNPKLQTLSNGITVTGKVIASEEIEAAQDYPNFRPTLDLNFAATKKLDSRITYERTGAASFVNEFGKVVKVGANVPRFDHDPMTRESKGLLIEESRHNVAEVSEDFDDTTHWEKYSQSVVTNAATAPDGTLTADNIIPAAGSSAARYLYFSNNEFPLATNTSYTTSIFVKKNGLRYFAFQAHDNGSGSGHRAGFDLDNGTVVTSNNMGSASNHSASIVEFPNGWFRCILSGTTASSGSIGRTAFSFSSALDGNASVGSITADGSSGGYVWGHQVEAGAFVTSYIPTDLSTAIRGADTTYIDGQDFDDFYNQPEGTIVSSHSLLDNIPATHNVYTYQVAPDSGTSEAPFRLIDRNSAYGNSLVATSITSGSSVSFFRASGNPVTPANKKMKIAFAIKTNDFAASFNGGTAVTDTAGTVSQTNDHIAIGYYKPSPQAYLNGHIQRLMYYPSRLSNTQLQNLTA